MMVCMTSQISFTTSKPANATKGDKTLRAAKKINPANNPNLTTATLDVIDSFFKD